MCGRFTSTTGAAALAEAYSVEEVATPPLPTRYNVAPTQPVYAVRNNREGLRCLDALRWGLVPSWARDPSRAGRMINARAEGLSSRPAFRLALERRRCVVPADAFYEWERATRRPWAIRRADGSPMSFAGLWDVWRDRSQPSAPPLRTVSIVTTSANGVLSPLHDRMPVVLAPGGVDLWLDRSAGKRSLEDLLVPAPEEWLERFAVSTRVNKVANEGPDLLEPERPRSNPGED